MTTKKKKPLNVSTSPNSSISSAETENSLIQKLTHLKSLQNNLEIYPASYMVQNDEFWELTAELIQALPEPESEIDESISRQTELLKKLIYLSGNARLLQSSERNFTLNNERAELALETLCALLGRKYKTEGLYN